MSLRQRLPLVGVFIVLLVLAVLAYAVPGRAEETEQAGPDLVSAQAVGDFGTFVVTVPAETEYEGDLTFRAHLQLSGSFKGEVSWGASTGPIGDGSSIRFPSPHYSGISYSKEVDVGRGEQIDFQPVVIKQTGASGLHWLYATVTIEGEGEARESHITDRIHFGVRHPSSADSYVYVNFNQVVTHVHDYAKGKVTYRFADGKTLTRDMTRDEQLRGDDGRTDRYSDHHARDHAVLTIRKPTQEAD